MDALQIIITGIVGIAIAGGALFAYKKNRNSKSTQKNITIHGNGKIVGGDDNSINNTMNSSK